MALFAGWVVVLAGLFFFPSRKAYKIAVYILFILPSAFLAYQYLSTEKRVTIPLVCFCAVLLSLAVSALWSYDPDLFRAVRRAVVVGLLPFSFFYLLKEKKAFYWASIMGVSLVSLLLLYWTSDTLLARHCLRTFFRSQFLYHIKSMFNPLMLGHVLGFLFALTAGIAICERGMLRSLAWGNMAILGIAVFFVGERTPLVSLLFMGIVLLLFNPGTWNTKEFYMAILFVLSLLFFYHDYLFWLLTKGKGMIRIPIWMKTFEIAMKSPVFGHGWDSPILIHIHYNHAFYTFHDAHNLFLQMLYYSGFVGLIALVALYVSTFFYAIRYRDIFSLAMVSYGFMAIQTDGMGLLSKPKEEWFNACLPVAIVVASSLLHKNKGRKKVGI